MKKLHLKIVSNGTDYEEIRVAPSPIVGGAAPPEAAGTGTGLKGEDFDNMDLTALKTTRTDATVAFDWGYGLPTGALTGADTFSARWTS